MQNIAEFRIIGRVGKITTHDKVTLFGKLIECATKVQKGDLVYIAGRVRQNAYDTSEDQRYTVEFIAGYDQASSSAAAKAAVQSAVQYRGTGAMRL